MRKKFIHDFSAFMAFVLMLTFAAPSFAASQNDEIRPAINGEQWMAYLPNSTKLSNVNLPGTNASGAAKMQTVMSDAIAASAEEVLAAASVIPVAATLLMPLLPILSIDIPIELSNGISVDAFARTQALFIDEQLNAGSRVINVHLSAAQPLKGNENAADLLVSNRGFKCVDRGEKNNYLTFQKVLDYATDFVAKHPTETVIINAGGDVDPLDFNRDISGEFPEFLKKFAYDDFVSEIFREADFDEHAGTMADQILSRVKESLKSDSRFIIDGDIPTVGEARGKVIIADWESKKDYNDHTCDGNQKWEGRSNAYRQEPENEKNGIRYYLDNSSNQDYTKTGNSIDKANTACTNDDGDGIKTSVFGLLRSVDGLFGKVFELVIKNQGEDSLKAGSAAEAAAAAVNPRLKSYNWQKGKYCGNINVDFIDSDIAQRIYETNIFDFDVAGKALQYISDIVIAYDEDFADAQNNLRKNGYQILDSNFNEEGPDTELSDVMVNGIRYSGLSNLAIGYKMTTDASDAITGIIWTNKKDESDVLDDAAQALIDKYDFKLVQTVGMLIDTNEIKSIESICNLNIGTQGRLVNLYVTKDSRCGEKLIKLTSIQSYNKTLKDPNTHEPYNSRIVSKANEEIDASFKCAYLEMPRDAKGYVFSSNYGRNLVNDVYLFYDAAFHDPEQPFAYFKLYNGNGEGTLRELQSPSNRSGSAISGGSMTIIIVIATVAVLCFAVLLVCRKKRSNDKI